MWLQEVEGRVLEQFIYDGVSLADASAMRRLPPVHRDLFDNFVFAATAVAVGESDWSRFPIACLGYMSAVHGALTSVPPLIPPDTADVVADVLSRFTPFKSGDERVADGSRINEGQYRLAEELFTRLGGVDRASPTALHAKRFDMLIVFTSMSTARRLSAGLKIFQSLPATRPSPARRRRAGV